MSQRIVSLDVREDLRRGLEPFSAIMEAIARLDSNEALQVIAPFEPVPLMSILERQGFAHRSQSRPDGAWEVIFTRQDSPQPVVNPVRATTPVSAEILEIDARGLEPPQPLVRILEALATLPPGARLRARTDRRPMHLYPQLDLRGLTGDTIEEKDGSFITLIRPV